MREEAGVPGALHRAATAIVAMLALVYATYALLEVGGRVDAVRGVLPFVVVTGWLVLVGRGGPVWAPLRLTAPIVIWAIGYDAAVRVLSLTPDRFVDSWLAMADGAVIGLLGVSPVWPLGGFAEEIANLLYVSFYAVVPLGLLWAWNQRGEEAAARYGLALVVALASCAALWLVFPAGGYHPNGGPEGHAVGPFTWIVRSIYSVNPHYAAAFPSSHVAIAVAVAFMLRRLGGSSLWLLWALGVAWSTFQGQYHYLVDSPPAIVLGWAASRFAVSTRGLAGAPALRALIVPTRE